ncbi:hypothetical protein GLE_0573 [Lysobacter enzymogenes]|uniref:Uncharacterized protein n=1 Tax=Lysobacter enzymogenes TaxID=69 RepID=A0A0S2DBM1_LYSEN|nr:hypothetical protein GLE_0573 [Lysobacter enzymogenes]
MVAGRRLRSRRRRRAAGIAPRPTRAALRRGECAFATR